MKKFILLVFFAFIALTLNAQRILIYGGEDNEVFLGILNAPPSDSKSIWNEYSEYGNKYNSESIWNAYGTYGSEYNSYCPWNEYSSSSPILLDSSGNYYGKFNSSNSNDIVRKICELGTTIQKSDKDLDFWYELLFY